MGFNWADPDTWKDPFASDYSDPFGFNDTPTPIVVAPDSGTSTPSSGFDYTDPFGFNKVEPITPPYIPSPIQPGMEDVYLEQLARSGLRLISPVGAGSACADMIAVVQNGYKYWLTLPEYQALGSPAVEEVTEAAYIQIPDGKTDIIVNGTKITAKDTSVYCTVSTGKDAGKELVMEFSGPIDNSLIIQKITEYGTKIMKLVGGTEVYIEDRTKLVVAL